MTEYTILNPDLTNHQQAIKEAKKVVENNPGLSTKKLAEKLSDSHSPDWEISYWRSILSDIRPYLIDKDWLDVDEKREGGNPTYYWYKNSSE